MADEEQPMTALAIGAEAGQKILETPAGHPDLIIEVITPLMAILARAGNVFFQTLVGSIGASAVGIIPGDTIKTGVLLAGSAAFVCVLQSLVTIFGSLEKKFPLLRA